MFKPLKTFVATGAQTKMYTLRKWGVFEHLGRSWEGSIHIQNLANDKDRAVLRGQEISDKLGLPFEPEIDFELNEIERRNNLVQIEEAHSVEVEDPSEDLKWVLDKNPDDMEGQELAIYKILSGENIFVTGGGGVGKSFIIRQIVNDNTILCAPSGIASLNIGGATCHKTFGLPLSIVTKSDYKVDARFRSLFEGNDITRIVIDEISMLRTDYLDLIDFKLKRVRRNDRPFGGIQMVVVGDFFQLPPIVNNNDKEIFYEDYISRFCFTSKSWNFETVELTKVFRQSDQRQVNILKSIRCKDDRHEKALRLIQKEAKEYNKDDNGIHLCVFNADVDRINKYWFDRLHTKQETFIANSSGVWGKDAPVPERLLLKEGAKVVICANHPQGIYQNGLRGVIKSISRMSLLVTKDNGEDVLIEKHKWEKVGYKRDDSGVHKHIEATFEQYPLKLGWAISMHKSQGMTLDSATINVGRGCFEHGQLYVALSRVKDLRNLSFAGYVTPNNIIVETEVQEFYNGQT